MVKERRGAKRNILKDCAETAVPQIYKRTEFLTDQPVRMYKIIDIHSFKNNNCFSFNSMINYNLHNQEIK